MAELSKQAPVDPNRSGRFADFLSSIVVFMVALPLCIGISQACGLPPEAGIATGVIGGILVGLLAGSPLQVSGPAAGLIVLVIQFLDEARQGGHTDGREFYLLGVVILLSGLIQVAAGLLRCGQWFRAVSPAVVGGMLAGIGITIIAKQFHAMVDDEAPKKVVDGLIAIPGALWKAISPMGGGRADHQAAAIIGAVTIVILLTWKSIVPRMLGLIPAAVVAVVAAVAMSELAGWNVDRVRVSTSFLEAFTPIPWLGWEVLGSAMVWKAAFTFAVIASAETLLCAVAVDSMHTGPRTKFDRELIAQGIGNMACGAVAALPMTGVIVRSSANVEAGARTRWSAVLHGLWLLLFVAFLPQWLSRIPAAALAAILVYTGWKLVNLPGIVRLWKQRRSEAVIFVVTALAIVATDLLTGVITGVVLSTLHLLWLVTNITVERHDEPEHRRVHLYLEGSATFLRLPVVAEALEAVPGGQKVHLHLDRLQFIDRAVMELIMSFQKQYEAAGGMVFVDWIHLYAHFHDPLATARNRQGIAHREVMTSAAILAEKAGTWPVPHAAFTSNGDGKSVT